MPADKGSGQCQTSSENTTKGWWGFRKSFKIYFTFAVKVLVKLLL